MGYPVRVAGLLVAVVALFFVARWVLGPGNLALFDPDRTKDVSVQASKPMQYLDIEDCASCHGERVEKWRSAAHRGLSCESCHGPAISHVESGASLAIEEPRELCARCHARVIARPAAQPEVDVEQHAGPVACTACHNPHAPSLGRPTEPTSTPTTELPATPGPATPTPVSATPTAPAGETVEPAGPPRVPHALEGRSECTVCHGPAGFKPFPADHAGRTSEVCLVCHQRE